MQFDLTPEQADAIRRAIESGRVSSTEDALHEAVDVWAKREQLRHELADLADDVRAMAWQDAATRARILSFLDLALGSTSSDVDDAPFRTFDEWSGQADRRAYADF